MIENQDIIAVIVLFTAIITFSIGVLAFLWLLAFVASQRDLFASFTSSSSAATKIPIIRSRVLNLLFLSLGALGVGALCLNIAYGQGNKHLVGATLLIAGGLVALETIIIFLIFLGQIMLEAMSEEAGNSSMVTGQPSGTRYLVGRRVIQQIVVVLGGTLMGGGLLNLVYQIGGSILSLPTPPDARDIVKLITLTAGGVTLLIGIAALIILFFLAVSSKPRQRMLPLWTVFGIGVFVGGLLLFLTQRLV